MLDEDLKKILEIGSESLKKNANTECIIGEKIFLGNITLVPISRVSAGYVSGGGEKEFENNCRLNAGAGGGYSISPIGFVSVNEKTGDVKIMPLDGSNAFERLMLDLVPKIAKNIVQGMTKGKKDKDEK